MRGLVFHSCLTELSAVCCVLCSVSSTKLVQTPEPLCGTKALFQQCETFNERGSLTYGCIFQFPDMRLDESELGGLSNRIAELQQGEVFCSDRPYGRRVGRSSKIVMHDWFCLTMEWFQVSGAQTVCGVACDVNAAAAWGNVPL